jgi:transcriptional regulator with XRE-family HTH domain
VTFGQRLRLLRDLAGYTSDAALEDAAGLTRGDFSRWAKDEYRPGAANRARLARILGVDLETLDGEGEGWQAIVRRQEVIRRARTAPDDEIARALAVLSNTAGPWRVYSAATRKSVIVNARSSAEAYRIAGVDPADPNSRAERN